ncbi:AfsR/SARP family transcriptional regulator [Actinocrispum wychmicini]|uniref:DNA-binding SARP family transcriptional activator n=1 Tax=Actinocrispum wychmicini TaxID=1213861 RepID=A0A4V2S423_9PSEU|nr:BTAD domain-containing putative transcriptional regulator [Actinocrispum wychmicini]TCO46550.1 DNA-binding SARP family transcriptional activator [Actinocrispum wychmicini]
MDTYRILGPLEVTVDGRAVPLGGRKPRMLLATLLLDPNTTVDVDTLVEVLWPDGPPRSAVANVRTYAHTLRAAVGDRVHTRSRGYKITVAPDELDMTTFEVRARAGRLAEASALWRGRALADLPRSPVWEPTLARLEELRLSVLERSMATRDDVIPELRGLLAEHPLREELWRQLVLGLHRSGRAAEALNAYADAERVLATELGTRPGLGLRRAQAVINQAAINAGVFPVCQLPLDIPDFTGRRTTVRRLVELLRGPKPVVAAVTGPPGAGKSTLAVHIGHHLAGLFPDGQLYVDLRHTHDALAYLMATLGIPDDGGTDAVRVARYRSALARRRILLVLDNATDVGAITPLLPGSGGSAVIVTGRRAMPDLPGAVGVPITALSDAEAGDLLARIAGRRVREEPDHAAEVLRACGNLPLAVRVAGAKLATRPAVPVRVLAHRLRDERRRLDELTIGSMAVRPSVTDSYERLAPEAARAFRFAGLLGPDPFPGWALAALLDRPHADDVLDTLVDANLLDVAGSTPRYRLPDPFRSYAGERLDTESRHDVQAATRRVLDAYLALATHAAERIPVPFFGLLPRPGTSVAGAGDPVEWLAAERATVTALLSVANQLGLHDHAWRIPAVYAPFFDLRGRWDDWQRSHEIALRGARGAGDRHGEAIVQRNLGQLHLYQDNYPAAEHALDEALRLFTEAGDASGVGITLAGIGTTLRNHGRYRGALALHHRARRIFVRVAEPNLEAVARIAIGVDLLAQQRFPAAEGWLTGARELAADIGDQHREAHALQRLATLRGEQGDPERALDHLAEVTATFQQLGDDHCVAYARQHTAELCLRTGDRERAHELLTTTLDAHLRSGDRRSAEEVSHLLDQLS